MDDGSRPEKSTGYTPPIKAGKGSVSAPVESIDKKKVSPVYPNAPTKDASLTSTREVSPSELLAIQVMMGDFKELKAQLPGSWQASSNGKIYWCAVVPDRSLSVVEGVLFVDGIAASILLEKLLDK